MVSKPWIVAIVLTVSLLNIAWADNVCEVSAEAEVLSLALAVKTIYPNVSDRSLHYLYKNFVKNHKSCRDDEVWVQGPTFSEGGFNSEGEQTADNEPTARKLNNAFCMSKAQFELERDLGRSVFQTRVSSGTKNEGTSFLVGNNIIMTNYHIAAPGPDGRDCKALEVSLNTEKEDWVGCKRVLYCDKERDVCFVEMKQASPGIELGNLVPKMRLNCSRTAKQSGMLIGNPNSYGIQASAGPISAEVSGRIKHHIPMVGGASGSPVMNNNGEVLGINYGHVGTNNNIKNFVSLNEDTDYNIATSMYWIRNQITIELQKSEYNITNMFKGNTREDLKKIDDAFRLNPTCQNWIQ